MSATNTIDTIGDVTAAERLVQRTIDSFIDDSITSIGSNAFSNCTLLTDVSCPAVISIGDYAFSSCSSLTDASFSAATSIGGYAFTSCSYLINASFPVATSIGNNAFSNCSHLTNASFPAVTSIGNNTFSSCYQLTTASFPAATSIGSSAFSYCGSLTTLILGNTDQVATLANTNAFNNATNAIIYVPDALVSSYQSANNWSTYASRIKGISELPSS